MILAVDPGKRAGYAAFEPERAHLKQSGIVNGDSVREARFILDLFTWLDVLVVEDQFIPTGRDQRGRPRVMNQKGLKTLMLRRHIWEVLAMERGIPVESVNPKIWQAYFKIKAGDKGGICKVASVLVGKDVVEDEGDAILIGMWFIYNQGGAA